MLAPLKAKTEELLYLLLWGAEKLLRPTFRNLTGSLEEWAYGEGLQRQLWELERRQLLERQVLSGSPPHYRLTERGRVLALGGRDPVAAWSRPWDGQWRLVVFDLPEAKSGSRARLRRFLRDHRFGYLQNSVWIAPDPLHALLASWSETNPDVESLVTFEARPCSGESNAAIVSGAWDFERINALYRKCLAVLEQPPERRPPSRNARGPWHRWAQAERAAWLQAVSADPLLPRPLLPEAYLGERVWVVRQQVLGRTAGST